MDWHNKGVLKCYISSFFNKTFSDYLLFLYCGAAGVLFKTSFDGSRDIFWWGASCSSSWCALCWIWVNRWVDSTVYTPTIDQDLTPRFKKDLHQLLEQEAHHQKLFPETSKLLLDNTSSQHHNFTSCYFFSLTILLVRANCVSIKTNFKYDFIDCLKLILILVLSKLHNFFGWLRTYISIC